MACLHDVSFLSRAPFGFAFWGLIFPYRMIVKVLCFKSLGLFMTFGILARFLKWLYLQILQQNPTIHRISKNAWDWIFSTVLLPWHARVPKAMDWVSRFGHVWSFLVFQIQKFSIPALEIHSPASFGDWVKGRSTFLKVKPEVRP